MPGPFGLWSPLLFESLLDTCPDILFPFLSFLSLLSLSLVSVSRLCFCPFFLSVSVSLPSLFLCLCLSLSLSLPLSLLYLYRFGLGLGFLDMVSVLNSPSLPSAFIFFSFVSSAPYQNIIPIET